jgi:hypothetical protein
MGVSDCGAKRESRNGICQLVRIEVEYDGCNFQQRGHWRDGFAFCRVIFLFVP